MALRIREAMALEHAHARVPAAEGRLDEAELEADLAEDAPAARAAQGRRS